MRKEGQFQPVRNEVAYNIVRLLKACATQKDLRKGFKLHAYISEHKYLENNCYIANNLVNMYAKCGALAKAQQVLFDLPVRNVVTWSALIAGYAQQGKGEEALKCFHSMLREGHSPDAVTFTCVLKACGSIGAVVEGEQIHDKIVSLGLLKEDIVLASTLVDMYVKCGALTKAQRVLEELPVRDVVMWSVLITGYAQQGKGEEALKCYDSMQREGHFPDAVVFSCALKACASIGALSKGKQIHDEVVSLGMLEKDIKLGNTLVDMYAKCGALVKAQRVLQELPIRDVVTWNTIIAGYTQQGQGGEALKCFDSMRHDGQSPNALTFTCALKACGSIEAITKGEQIHDEVASLGMLEKDIALASTLVDMYAKCGALAKAHQVLKQLPTRDVIMWNALIAGYAQQGKGEEALKCYDDMQHEGYSPNVVTFTCALKACGCSGAVVTGKHIHYKIVSLGILEKDTLLGNALVDMYAKCGSLEKAQQVLEELSFRDVVTWSALIAGYAQHGQGEEALKCFDVMQHEGHSPNALTFMSVLQACGNIGATTKGEEIHGKIVSLGMLEKDLVLGNILVDMYIRCDALAKAQQVLEELPVRDTVTWSTLIAGYAQRGQGEDALKCYDSMQQEGHSPNVVTFLCVLKACGSIGAAAKGQQIHDTIVMLGLLETDALLGSALVDMYAKCGALAKAQKVLEELPARDVVIWTALITGYVQHGQGEEALKCFDSMQREVHSPNAVTFILALKACGSIGATAKGIQIHDMIDSLGMLEKDTMLGNALVDMYAKCGALAQAQQVLELLPVRDVATWSTLIAGYAEQGQGEEALKCYDSMQCEGHAPDKVTFICALKACGSIGAASKGKQIHEDIVTLGVLEGDIVLGSILVDMYAKCGALTKAQQVLEELSVQDVVSWSALLAGYAQQGQSLEAIKCFERMQSKGMKPDSTTLTCMLNACSHSGLLDEAEMLFSRISTEYGLIPDTEHCCCMADLFGRVGKFSSALEVIEKMTYVQYPTVYVSLLGSCRIWGEVKIGRLAFDHAFCLDTTNASIFVCMANMYRAVGMPQDADGIEVLQVANMPCKLLGGVNEQI